MVPNLPLLLRSSCGRCSLAIDLAEWRKSYPLLAFSILANGPTGLNDRLEPAYFSSCELEERALSAQEKEKCVPFLVPFLTDDLFCSLSLGSAL